jgi:hypothetical protein
MKHLHSSDLAINYQALGDENVPHYNFLSPSHILMHLFSGLSVFTVLEKRAQDRSSICVFVLLI